MTQTRLLTLATVGSLAVHTAALGGWMVWHAGSGGSGADVKNSKNREVRVRLKSAPAPAASSEQSDRSRARAMASTAVSAERVLNDPKTGLIFSAYFKAVRARLSQAASATRVAGVGTGQFASIRFVLDREGGVLSSAVREAASARAAKAALNILAESAPFLSFPAAIRHEAISFDVRFRFDEE